MSNLFKTIPKSIPQKQPDDYKANFQTIIRTLVRGWFIDNMNAKISRIKRRQSRKNEKIKEYNIK